MNPALGRSSLLLDRLLAALGVRPRPFRALVRAQVLMDFRSQHFARATASGPKALITPLFWVIGQYLLIGLGVAIIAVGRFDAYFFALLALGTSMLTMATSVIVEFNEIVLDEKDLQVLGHQPISLRTYAAARMTNLLAYTLLMSLALNLVPAIVGVALPGGGWTFLPAYLFASFVGNLFVTAGVILIYTLIVRGGPASGTREMLAWTQIILIMVLFYGGQLMFKGAGRFEMLSYAPPAWIAYLTPAWLATFVDSFGVGPAIRWDIGLSMAGATLVLWVVTCGSLARAHAAMQPGVRDRGAGRIGALRRPGNLAGPISSLLVRPGQETAAFWLCSTMLRRDADLRMRSWPAVGIVFAALVLGLATGQLRDPLVAGAKASAMSLACVYLLALPVPTILSNLAHSSEHNASWVLSKAPLTDATAMAEGARKAVTYGILLPVLAVVAIAFAAMVRAPVSAALHVAAAWLAVLAAGHLSVIGIMRDCPLSRPLARGTTGGPVMLWAGIVGFAAMFLALVHGLLVRSTAALAIHVACLFVLTMALAAISRRITSRRVLRGGGLS